MNIQRFIAPTSREALAKARSVFGEGTLILSNRATAQGVEVMATAEDNLHHMDSGQTTSSGLRAAIQAREAEETRPLRKAPAPVAAPAAPVRPAAPVQVSPRQSVAEDTEQLAMSTLSFQDYVRERMLRRRSEGIQATDLPDAQLPTFARKARQESLQAAAAPQPVRQNPLRAMTTEQPQAKALQALPAVSPGMLHELQSVKSLIEERFNTLAWLGQTRQNPLQSNLILKLIRAGFSPALARTLIERVPQNSGPAEALRWLMQVLERNLRTDAAASPIYEVGGVFALIGSTGVGKTTTAAKLAALCAQKHGPQSVGLITLDTYRVGGHEQLRAYGRMLGVVAHLAHDKAALQDLLGLLSGKKMVIIDTTGVAPRDPRKDDILQVLDLPGVQQLLVTNAGCHGDTLDESLAAFKHGNCRQAILSKVDEAVKLGPALDALIRHQMVLRGVTTGQRVPEDFERAVASELIATSMRTHSKSAFDPSSLDLDFFYADSPLGAATGGFHA
ncbi:flagellar biosynthesis protein FlhF [Comamonas nitrativorans]|uniref:Flagellar biosynthesis protein FlhF n=1 Tax=Comamonas nitrativorans TaxID=108437 RepID=A0ABV9GZ72_9BURK